MITECPSCNRPVYGDGLLLIEGAFQSDGSCVVSTSLTELENSIDGATQEDILISRPALKHWHFMVA